MSRPAATPSCRTPPSSPRRCVRTTGRGSSASGPRTLSRGADTVMTRLDADAPELAQAAGVCGPRALLLESREVPLCGVRAMEVHRMLPQRDLPTVGAWCFLDRFGPQVARMRVEPPPHIGLQ